MHFRKILTATAVAGLLAGNAYADEVSAGKTHDKALNKMQGDTTAKDVPNDGTAGATHDNALNKMRGDTTAGDSPKLDSQSFVTKAGQDGMAEVELGKLALKHGQSSDVKQFGQQMVTDHSKANQELTALAKKENLTVPTTIGAEHQAAMDELAKKEGAEFDRAFVAKMNEDHEKAVKLFRDASKDASVDEDLRQFAQKTLPTLEHHKDEADLLDNKVKTTAGDNPRRAMPKGDHVHDDVDNAH